MMQMSKRMPHAIVLILFVVAFPGVPSTAHAWSCASRQFTLEEAYAAADSIIVGLVTECRDEVSKELYASGGGDCSFSSLEVIKEAVPAHDYSGVASSTACGLSLHVGNQYLLFLDNGNQPLHFSAALGGDRYSARFARRYLDILRDFRYGQADNLAEPWLFMAADGTCSILHRVRDTSMVFSHPMAGAPKLPEPDWTRDTVDGKPVYRGSTPIFAADSQLPASVAEIVAFGDAPGYYDEDVLMLSVSVAESSPAPVRRVTLSVGDKTWSLMRMEMNISLSGSRTQIPTVVDYYRAGDVAEQILSAMAKPSNIVVSAIADGSPDDSSEIKKEHPEPVLRMESRSTHMARETQSFHACYAGQEK